jgi:hypothetical protein
MLLDIAEGHIRRSARLRRQIPQQVKRERWIQPGLELSFSNERLVYDFFQEAMSGVLLGHTALDNFANEALPPNVVMNDAAGQETGRAQIEYWGLPKRLTQVLPFILGKESIKAANPAVWSQLVTLKNLRDGIGHVHYEATFTAANDDPGQSLFSQLLATDLLALLKAVEETIVYYS